MRIALIGPVYPYKGGIAHYTGLLAKELAKTHDVQVFSFLKQYPRFLYPGEQQKDYENDSLKYERTRYLLNSINPFSWFRTAYAVNNFAPDLVIFPWWNPFFGPAFFTIASLVKLAHRTKVMFMIHNVLPHERLPFDRLITELTLGRGDFHIVQSSESEVRLLALLPFPVYRKAVLPAFHSIPDEELSRDEARTCLSLPVCDNVILFFGFVREYKGLKYLIEALPVIRARLPDTKLLIVGDFFTDRQLYERRIEELGVASMVVIHDGYIPDSEVSVYFSAADLVVLPYTSASQSGIVQIAFGFGKPVVVTSVGGLPEVVADGSTGYVIPPKNSKALAESVIRFFTENKGTEFSAAIVKERERFSWKRMVVTIEALMRENK
ncbi:MAG: glycosyltransferase [Geobacteraceae bacterium]|nr:glycosyltransferase [Geobacteraceae bacterium]